MNAQRTLGDYCVPVNDRDEPNTNTSSTTAEAPVLLTDGGEDIDDVEEDDAPPAPEDAPPEETEDDVPVADPDADSSDEDDDTDVDELLIDAMQVFSDAKDRMQGLDPHENDDDNLEEVKAVNAFKNEMGELVAQGLDESDAHAQCGQLAQLSTYNKSQLKNKVNSSAQKAANQSSTRRTFDTVLKDDLVEVVKVKSSDHHQGTVYRWHFKKGTVETRQSKDEAHSHFEWTNFRDDYFDAANEMPTGPTGSLQGGEEWRKFVADILDARGREEPNKGPRTVAVEELRSNIGSAKGYAKLEDACRQDGVYVDDDPENGSPDEVWVPNSAIKRICDNNELGSTRALQLELDARHLTSPQVAGVSHTESVNGRSVTFWRLKAEFATPADYVVDPKTPAQKVAARAKDDDDDHVGSKGSGQIDSVTADDGGDVDE